MIKHHMIGVRIKIKIVCIEMCLRCYQANRNSFEFRWLLFDISWWMHVSLQNSFRPSRENVFHLQMLASLSTFYDFISAFHFSGERGEEFVRRRLSMRRALIRNSCSKLQRRRKSSTIRVHETIRNLPKIIKNQVRKKFSYWQRKFCVKHTREEAWSSIRTVSLLVPLTRNWTLAKNGRAKREEKKKGKLEIAK